MLKFTFYVTDGGGGEIHPTFFLFEILLAKIRLYKIWLEVKWKKVIMCFHDVNCYRLIKTPNGTFVSSSLLMLF